MIAGALKKIILNALGGVNKPLGDRVYIDRAPKDAQYPFVIVRDPLNVPGETLDGQDEGIFASMQIDCYAMTPLAASRLAVDINNVLKDFAGIECECNIEAITGITWGAWQEEKDNTNSYRQMMLGTIYYSFVPTVVTNG